EADDWQHARRRHAALINRQAQALLLRLNDWISNAHASCRFLKSACRYGWMYMRMSDATLSPRQNSTAGKEILGCTVATCPWLPWGLFLPSLLCPRSRNRSW